MIALNTKVEEQARQQDELAELDDIKEIYRGYTNKEHWKYGNRVKLSKTFIEKNHDVIEAAVIFFTGGGCMFYYTGEKRKTYWCEFEGYFANGMEG